MALLSFNMGQDIPFLYSFLTPNAADAVLFVTGRGVRRFPFLTTWGHEASLGESFPQRPLKVRFQSTGYLPNHEPVGAST